MEKLLKIGLLVIEMFTLCSCGKSVDLSDEQIESLCEQFAEINDYYGGVVPSKAMAAIKVYGVERKGDIGYVYCYASEGTYIKVNGKAYDISGGNGPNVLKVQFKDDEIVMLDRDYSLSALETLDKFPLKYRLMDRAYEPYSSSGHCKLQLEEVKKIEDFWGIDVELEYCIDIHKDGTYEVWDFPYDEKIIIETGTIKEK